MPSQKFSIPRGTNDILPDEISQWQAVEEKARQIMSLYGYREIRTPIFEETGLFERSLGATSDVVQKQMLNLQKDGLSLRPEGTAAIVRSYIENDIDKKEHLAKWFYMGPMFRGERPQKGRLRQFHQIGVEAIGPGSSLPYVDAEVTALAVHLLRAFGLKDSDFQLKINTLGSPEDKENFSRLLREKLKSQLSHLCEDCKNRFERNVFRILDCKNKECKGIVDHLHFDDSYLSKESREHFQNVKEALNSLSIRYEVSSKLVRGLDYYTHSVFEISSPLLGSQDALGAGGRYNNLVAQLGGSQVESVGFAMGIERILLALGQNQSEQKKAIQIFFITLDEQSMKKAFEILNLIRQQGIAGDMSYKASSMKSQMRLADKVGAPFVGIIGESEIQNNILTLKDMQTGDQQEIGLSDLAKLFSQLQSKGN